MAAKTLQFELKHYDATFIVVTTADVSWRGFGDLVHAEHPDIPQPFVLEMHDEAGNFFVIVDEESFAEARDRAVRSTGVITCDIHPDILPPIDAIGEQPVEQGVTIEQEKRAPLPAEASDSKSESAIPSRGEVDVITNASQTQQLQRSMEERMNGQGSAFVADQLRGYVGMAEKLCQGFAELEQHGTVSDIASARSLLEARLQLMETDFEARLNSIQPSSLLEEFPITVRLLRGKKRVEFDLHVTGLASLGDIRDAVHAYWESIDSHTEFRVFADRFGWKLYRSTTSKPAQESTVRKALRPLAKAHQFTSSVIRSIGQFVGIVGKRQSAGSQPLDGFEAVQEIQFEPVTLLFNLRVTPHSVFQLTVLMNREDQDAEVPQDVAYEQSQNSERVEMAQERFEQKGVLPDKLDRKHSDEEVPGGDTPKSSPDAPPAVAAVARASTQRVADSDRESPEYIAYAANMRQRFQQANLFQSEDDIYASWRLNRMNDDGLMAFFKCDTCDFDSICSECARICHRDKGHALAPGSARHRAAVPLHVFAQPVGGGVRCTCCMLRDDCPYNIYAADVQELASLCAVTEKTARDAYNDHGGNKERAANALLSMEASGGGRGERSVKAEPSPIPPPNPRQLMAQMEMSSIDLELAAPAMVEEVKVSATADFKLVDARRTEECISANVAAEPCAIVTAPVHSVDIAPPVVAPAVVGSLAVENADCSSLGASGIKHARGGDSPLAGDDSVHDIAVDAVAAARVPLMVLPDIVPEGDGVDSNSYIDAGGASRVGYGVTSYSGFSQWNHDAPAATEFIEPVVDAKQDVSAAPPSQLSSLQSEHTNSYNSSDMISDVSGSVATVVANHPSLELPMQDLDDEDSASDDDHEHPFNDAVAAALSEHHNSDRGSSGTEASRDWHMVPVPSHVHDKIDEDDAEVDRLDDIGA